MKAHVRVKLEKNEFHFCINIIYVFFLSDTSIKKKMAVIIVHWNGKYKIDLVERLRCLDATASTLTQSLIDLLNRIEIEIGRMVGFSGDTCNVMFGAKNSITQKLKELNPNILTVKCSFHSINLCASKACRMLPNKVRKLINY